MNEHVPAFTPAEKDDVAWLGSEPVPAAPYYDPGYFELEREAVFKRTWLQVGHICELPEPGSFIRCAIEVANASLLIVRGKDEVVRAFHNVCTHRGTELVEAQSGRQAAFTCRYHGWTFGQDGSLRAAPDFERFYVDKAQCALKQVAVEVFAGLIFVHLGTPQQSVREWLGDLAEEFERLPIARATQFVEYGYEIDANWKLTYDNFQENYHLRFLHPRTGGPGCTQDNPFAYPLRYNFHGPHRTQTIWSNPNPPAPAKVQGVAYSRIGEAVGRAGLFGSALNLDFICLFPTFTLFGLPSRQFTQVIMPLGAGRSRGIVRFYWVGAPDSASERFAREYVMASQRDIHVEDRYVVEAGQRGLATGAIRTINFQVNEALCRHLFNTVDGMVRAYRAEQEAGA
jgi:phenylpropionate dioxygenase-like ring-hydroxylating dioxygenase large terminal subunit